ncbi:MAG: hypothetical protein JSW12_16780 [Deltaproteobacteria bacterium]|nr:MAG: hypothetical protein JSW12_16780 [Deltaproteobacteria bacterium]
MESPSETSKVKIIPIGGRSLPAVSLGTSPFIGAGQFGSRALTYRSLFFDNPANMVNLMVYAAQLGVPCVQLLAVDRILDAFRDSRVQSGVDLACTLTVGFGDRDWELNQASDINPQLVFLHAMVTDRLDLKGIERWLKDIRDLGLVPGCVTHKPARVLPVLVRSGLDIAAFMVPFNQEGIFMDCKPDALIKILDSIDQPVIAKKTLAAGALSPSDSLPFIAQYTQIHGLALGLTSREEMKESLSIAISHWPR